MFSKNLFIVLSVLIIAACEPPKVPSDHLTVKNGIAYIHLDKPFTGISYSKWRNGNQRRLITYEKGLRHGLYEAYFKDGQLKIKSNYQKGKLAGPYEEYYENGKLKIKSNYQKGKLAGRYEEYYENGPLKISTSFLGKYNNGKIDDTYMGGMIKDAIGQYYAYYENGRLSKSMVFAEVFRGTYAIHSKGYQPDGTLRSIKNRAIVHQNSERGQKIAVYHGVQKDFNPDGTLDEVKNFNYGDLHGIYQVYNGYGLSGNRYGLKVDARYDLGVLCGLYQEYNIRRNVIKEINYKKCREKIPPPQERGMFPVDQ